MAQSITAVRALMVGGTYVAPGGTASVDDALAAQLVFNGDATYVTPPTQGTAPDNYAQVAAGLLAWSGTTATNNVTVTGILANDVVVCSLVAQNATETLVKAVADPANNRFTITLSANGGAATRVAWSVLRSLSV